MKRTLTLTTLVSVAALGLAACDSEDVENTSVDDIDELVDEDVSDEPYPVGGDLNEEQQANYEAMDWQAVSDEYDANMADMQSEMESGGGMADGSSGEGMSDSGDSSDGASMSDDSMSDDDASVSGTSLPPRGEMNFSYLDRNGDGQLSVAEYAIWALPTNPNPPEPNDAIGPHLTQDQINEAGQTFFYFDDDGDSYLSEQEFQDARNSGRTA